MRWGSCSNTELCRVASTMGEWFEDEEFWAVYAPLMFDEATWAEVPEVVDGISRLVSLPGGSRVLDLCCGVGRHSLEFARRGHKVTGVDLTRTYLDAARESSAAENLDIEFVRADARSYSAPRAFDLCVNLFTSFGYFAAESDDLAMLRRCRENLAQGGHLVIETLGREIAQRDFISSESFERAGFQVRTEYEILGDWKARRNRWILGSGEAAVDRSFVLRLYSGEEISGLLREAGFGSVLLFGSFDGKPYDRDAVTMIAVAGD